jgi:hypothetical protein
MKRLPAIVFAAAVAAHAAAEPPPIGRLFTTPSERVGLDRLRDAGGRAPEPAQAPGPAVTEVQAAPAPPPPPEPISVTGIVRRSDGTSVVWINGVPQTDQAVSRSAGGTPAATVTLPSGQRATLKAGQAVDVNTGAVGDARR